MFFAADDDDAGKRCMAVLTLRVQNTRTFSASTTILVRWLWVFVARRLQTRLSPPAAQTTPAGRINIASLYAPARWVGWPAVNQSLSDWYMISTQRAV